MAGSRSLGTLTVDLVAKTAGFEQGMDRAARTADRKYKGMQRSATEAGKSIGAAFARNLGGAIAGAFSAVVVTRATEAFIRQADVYSQMAARLRVVTDTSQEAADVQQRLFALAQEGRTSYEGLAQLYTRIASGSKELRDNQEALLTIVDTVSKAFTVSGTTAAEASSAMLQLSQALASGVLRGEEFNAIFEASPRIMQAIADGLNVPIGALREMAKEGKLTADVVVQAIQSQADTINDEFSRMPVTVSSAVQKMRNAMLELIGSTDQTAGASGDLAQAISDLADTLNSPEVKNGLSDLVSGIAEAGNAAVSAIPKIAEFLSSVSEIGSRIREALAGGERQLSSLTYAITGNFTEAAKAWQEGTQRVSQAIGETEGFMTAADRKRAERAAKKAGESIADNFMSGISGPLNLSGGSGFNFAQASGEDQARSQAAAVPGWLLSTSKDTEKAAESTDKLTKAIQRQTSARNELSEADKAWLEFEEDMKALQEEADQSFMDASFEKIQAMQREAEERERSMQDGAKLLDDLRFEMELMRMTNAERETAIQLRGMDAEAIARYGEEIAQANQQLEQMAEIRSLAESAGQSFTDMFTDIAFGTKSAKDAFSDFIQDVTRMITRFLLSKAIEQFLNAFMGGASFGGGGGGFSFGGARAAGGSVSPDKYYLVGEKGPEIFVPDTAGQILPNGSGRQMEASGGVNINQTFVIGDKNQGATNGQSDAFARRMQMEMEVTAKRVINEEQRQGGSLWRMTHA